MTSPLGEISYRLSRPRTFAIWVFDRLFDRILDRRFGIDGSQRRSPSSLGIDAPDRAGYQPISYLDFEPMMKDIPRNGTLVDFGSGAGRCICLASKSGFKNVIGVELSQSLCETARQNIQACDAAGV